MRWIKRGLVYAPTGEWQWARTHALLPTPLLNADGTVRVYFSSLDDNQFGSTAYADVHFTPERAELAHVTNRPLLESGDKGTFDDCGVTPSCAVRVDNSLYLYYVGFQRAERVPYMIFSGLAIGDAAGGAFRRHSKGAVLDRTADEPFSRGAPFVMRENGAFRAWYWSCTHWSEGPNGIHYNNVIRHATSPDGIHWTASENICLSPQGDQEFALGRPCVIFESDIYRMWYSIRSYDQGYTMGYAESEDGLRWERMDHLTGIGKSASGWDSEMACYPAIFDLNGTRYLLYNGNRCGRTGFGYAVLEQ
jgi:hypothetical protein